MADDKKEVKPKDDAFKYMNAARDCAGRYDMKTNSVIRLLAQMGNYKKAGVCFPSYEYIMQACSMSHGAVANAIKKILDEKLWSHQVRFGSSSLYFPNLAVMKEKRWLILTKFQLAVVKRISKFVDEGVCIENLMFAKDDDNVCLVLDWYAAELEATTPKPFFNCGGKLMIGYDGIRARYMNAHKDEKEYDDSHKGKDKDDEYDFGTCD